MSTQDDVDAALNTVAMLATALVAVEPGTAVIVPLLALGRAVFDAIETVGATGSATAKAAVDAAEKAADVAEDIKFGPAAGASQAGG